jgi:hypothetical protein
LARVCWTNTSHQLVDSATGKLWLASLFAEVAVKFDDGFWPRPCEKSSTGEMWKIQFSNMSLSGACAVRFDGPQPKRLRHAMTSADG